MALINTYLFTQMVFLIGKFMEATGNEFVFVSQRPYFDKHGKAGSNGAIVTLMVIHDNMNYGNDKEGNPLDNNVMQTFDVTILNGQTHLDLTRGDHVSLIDYDPDHSYVYKKNHQTQMILRFKDINKIEKAE